MPTNGRDTGRCGPPLAAHSSPMEETTTILLHIMDKGEESCCCRGGAPPTLPCPHRWPPSILKYSIYTDGSNTDECMGASVRSCECALRFCLLTHTSVFSAEFFPTDKAIGYALDSSHRSIFIFSDFMSALQAIEYGRMDTNEIQGNIINKLN